MANTHTLLFIGCGQTLDDLTFHNLITWCAEYYAKSNVLNYVLCKEDDEAHLQKKLQSHHWLKPLVYGKQYDELVGFLAKLNLQPNITDISNGHSGPTPTPPVDTTPYLTLLNERNSHIEIRGLQVSSGRAPRFPIDDLYIPLKTSAVRPGDLEKRDQSKKRNSDKKRTSDEKRQEHLEAIAGGHGGRIELSVALRERALLILGDPGAGKTTLLRRIAHLLAAAKLQSQAQVPEVQKQLGWDEVPFPIWMRVADLAQFIQEKKKSDDSSLLSLPQFLAHMAELDNIGLDQKYFEKQLDRAPRILLIDGLDEAPNDLLRKQIMELVEKTYQRYQHTCRFIVTSRPAALQNEVALPGFSQVEIAPLEDHAIEVFLNRWCAALFQDSQTQANDHYQELLEALRLRVEIHRMARNPVMLTALAVVHWNEKRLPQQRADLYESIMLWLARAREQRAGRMVADRCIQVLQDLALAMQDHEGGRRVQVNRHHWAADQIKHHWRELPEDEQLVAAKKFLEDEENDSGIVVRRGDEIRFWHLTFQEYLAARALTAQDKKRPQILASAKIYWPEWKEVIRLLAGALHHQGLQRVDGMMELILDQLGTQPSLEEIARTVGLIGGAVHDLSVMSYQPIAPRYQQSLLQVEKMFSADWLGAVRTGAELKTRVQAAITVADVLGQVGTGRFDPEWLDQQWIKIPDDSFWLGAQKQEKRQPNYDEDAYEYQQPVRRVQLTSYSIARFPVTVSQYQRFVESSGYQEDKYWVNGGYGKFSKPEEWESQLEFPSRPVVGVSWFEAVAYCVWHGGVILLTEAQRERAARGPAGTKYPWGKSEPTAARCNFAGNVGHPTPVGIYPSGGTPEGVEEMSGNVWEWCWDWWSASYDPSQLVDPTGPSKGSSRAFRGGCWWSDAANCRSAYRGGIDPTFRGYALGFRLA
ncbi:MAG: SUMF1/EgtB/PvdO family nonheme iron enzyme, partial [Planctomycetota bacterium]